MLWLALEIVLGLALFIGIVWWTLPRARRDAAERPPED
jgi:cbb3-type cytochrome oxidase subunit 3